MINMYEMLMLMLWNVNACLTPRGVTGPERGLMIFPVIELSNL
jgi:hypothetical protein